MVESRLPHRGLVLLGRAFRDRSSGVLSLGRGEPALRLVVRDGHIVAVVLPEERAAALPPPGPDDSAQVRLDRLLAEMGIRSPGPRNGPRSRRSLRERMIAGLLDTSDAASSFAAGAAAPADAVEVAGATEPLILEAIRRVSDPDAVRGGLGDLDQRLVPTAGIAEERTLTLTEGYILSHVDGTATARDVLDLVPLEPEETERTLLGLLLTGRLEYRPAVAPATPRAASAASPATSLPIASQPVASLPTPLPITPLPTASLPAAVTAGPETDLADASTAAERLSSGSEDEDAAAGARDSSGMSWPVVVPEGPAPVETQTIAGPDPELRAFDPPAPSPQSAPVVDGEVEPATASRVDDAFVEDVDEPVSEARPEVAPARASGSGSEPMVAATPPEPAPEPAAAPTPPEPAPEPEPVAAAAPEPAPIDPAFYERRREALEYFQSLPAKNHFEVLGLQPGCTDAEVKRAYAALARRYHPDMHRRGGLEDLHDVLEAIFIRVGEAWEVLGDARSRRSYEARFPGGGRAWTEARAGRDPDGKGAGPVGPPPTEDEPEPYVPTDETLAQAQLLLAQARYWDAIQMLESRLPLMPPSKKQRRGRILLARAYAKNPNWLRKAEEALQQVVREDPGNVEAHYELGLLYKTGGMAARAQASFRRVLELRPEHRDAAAELGVKLASDTAAPTGGLLRRLFGRGKAS